MSPWPLGHKRDMKDKPVLNYFKFEDGFWICKILLDDEDEGSACNQAIKGAEGLDTNLG